MKKLIIDLNSIVTSSLLVGKDPDGFKEGGVQINTAGYGYNNFLNTYRKTLDELDLKPMHTIGVFDAPKSRERRQKVLEQYKTHRKPRPEEYYTEFNLAMAQAQRFIRHLGGTIVSAYKSEADDVIAHLAPKLDSIIWSKDKDLLSIGTPMWIDGDLILGDTCGDRFLGLPRKYVRLYRTLVGDPGDFGPGTSAAGFGQKAFIKLWTAFGDDGLQNLCDIIDEDAFDELADDVGELKELQKIIDNREMVYTTWQLAGWLPIDDHALKWKPGFAHERDCETYDADFDEFYQSVTLVGMDLLEGIRAEIDLHVSQSDYVALDIETDVGDESNEWLAKVAAYSKEAGKKNPIIVDVLESELAGLSLTMGDNMQHTYYFTINHADSDNIPTELIKDLVLSIDLPKIAHNAGGFEIPVLYQNWDVWVPDIYCSMIAANYVDENSNVGLKSLTKRYYHYDQVSYQDVTQGRGMSEIPAQEVLAYGADDTIMGGHLFNFFETVMDVEGTFDVYAVVEPSTMYVVAHSFVHGINVDLDLLQRLHDADHKEAEKSLEVVYDYLTGLEWKGSVFEPLIDLSPKEIKRGYYMLHGKVLKSQFRLVPKLAALVEDETYTELLLQSNLDGINAYIGDQFVPRVEFNPGSVKDKKELFYELLGFPVRFRKQLTEHQKAAGQVEGNPQADEDCMKWMIKYDANDEQKTMLKAMLRWTNYTTRNGLYYQPYRNLTHWSDGNIRPNLKQSMTTTRRFAPSAPNVSQLPKRSEEGRKVRGAIVPHHPDAVIVSPDFSGQELRLGAEETQDANFISCYIGEHLKDLHTITAFEINKEQGNEFNTYQELSDALDNPNDPLHKVAKEYRGVKAKPTNFLSQYVSLGGGAWTLSKKLQIPEEDAKKFLDAKSNAFPGVDDWKREYQKQVKQQGYAETLLGARKHTGALMGSPRGGGMDHVLRSALNFKIQSSGAEMTKLVMASCWEQELLFRFDARFYMPVHDEVCFSVMIEDLVAFTQALHPIMTQQYADMKIPLTSSLSVGKNFADLDEIQWGEESVQSWIDDHYRAEALEDIPY